MIAQPAPALARPVEAPLTGILLRSVAVVCFAIMAAAIKLATAAGANTVELLFYRNLFSFPVILGWVLIGPGLASLRTRRIGAHASRSAIGLVAMYLNFQAIMLLPLADATAISFSTPLFATALSAIVLAEPVGRHRWGAVLIGFVGTLVVVQPFGSTLAPGAIAIALVAAFGVACVHITLRQIGTTEAATTTVFWFTLASLAVLGLIMPIAGRSHPPEVWPMLIAIGVSGGIAQIVMTASLRLASVATLAPFDYVQLVWATMIGWWLFASIPVPATLLGGAIIASSGLYIAWRERGLRRDEPVTPAEPEL